MLSVAMLDYAAIEVLVLDTAAAVARIDRRSLDPSTSLLDARLDSLTLITLVTYVELACEVAFTSDELLELLRAADFGELSRRIAGTVDAARCTESARNAQNFELRPETNGD
jgi:hypothetical protein